jgi:2,3-bisphosphoglycerate-independent phosphoglycerate mutase
MDLCIGRIKKAIKEAGGVMIVSADHGNSDDMYEHEKKDGSVKKNATGKPKAKTAHSLNPVPCIIFDPEGKGEYKAQLKDGLGISALAATIIEFLGFEAPEDYDSSVLEY